MSAETGGSWIDYPEIPELRATGVVAEVYAGIRAMLPFVPSLFRSLAVCPGYLQIAWAQVDPVFDDRRFVDAASSLADEVADVVQPPAEPVGRRLVARYASGRMLLAACGLERALYGDLERPAARPQDFVRPAKVSRAPTSLSALPVRADMATYELFGDIRRRLGTPILNTVWKAVAAEGCLPSVWGDLGPQVDIALREAGRVERLAAEVSLKMVPWRTAATPSALQHHGLTDAIPGIGAILAAYRTTLARVLVLVSSSREEVTSTSAGTCGPQNSGSSGDRFGA